MKAKRWTFGIVLVAAVGLFGLIQAGASPFSTSILTDDLSNRVNGAAPDVNPQDESGSADDGSSAGDTAADSDTGNGNNGHGNNADGVDSSNPSHDNNGNGNNADGVDSSNPGKGGNKTDASCLDPNNCVDDEIGGGSSTSTSSGKAKGKTK